MARKSKSKTDEKYSDKEAKRRFEAALLGSRLVSANPKNKVRRTPKRVAAKRK